MGAPSESELEVLTGKEAVEQKYMRLLERRIAQLEQLVGGHEKDKIPDAVTATASATAEPTNSDKGEKNTNGTEEGDKDESGGDDKENEKDKPMARVRHLIARFNDRTQEFEDEEATKAADHAKGGDKNDSQDKAEPTIFRRVMDDENPKKLSYEEIEITSPELKRIYYSIAATVAAPEDSAIDGSVLNLLSPFPSLVWYWDKFEEACQHLTSDDEETIKARDDLKQLMALIRKSQLEPYFKVRDASLPKGNMPFEYLWTLFSPGSKVCARTFMDDTQMFEVSRCSTPSTGETKIVGKDFRILCIGLDWDGNKFGAFEYAFKLQKSSEQKEMQLDALEVYPVKYHRNDSLQQDLVKRGERFWSMCKPGKFQYDYSGAVLAVKPSRSAAAQMLAGQDREDDDAKSTFSGMDESGGTSSARKDYSGQIIVDAYSFLRAQEDLSASDQGPPLGDVDVSPYSEYDCPCKACMDSPIVRWQKSAAATRSTLKQYDQFADKRDELCEARLMMCPPRVLGYALTGKMWAQFRIPGCTEVSSAGDDRRNYFKNQLQLGENYKKMLLAFVNNHQASRSDENVNRHNKQSALPKSLDVIEGKGKGLAILLHGPPGVGKTLTAETIALATGRPLLVVSVAEVGTKAANAESRLNVFFAIAARWGAILLIDEADVFLEERVHTDNPERNMLVSVLLRSLEYYEGIIFLTTNRVRSIDVAVQSRMHLAIQYKRLNAKQKAAIYRNLLEKVPDSAIKGGRDGMYKEIASLCRRNEMNGRQIRNIVSAALALAKERGNINDGGKGDARLKFEDLRKVHETTSDFLESLKDTTNKARQRNEAAEEDDDVVNSD